MKITALQHATFLVADLVRSRAFYEGVLGLQPSPNRPQMSFDGVWYELASNQQLHLMRLPDPEAGLTRPAHGGRDRHIALVVDDLDALRQKLERADVACTKSQSGRPAMFCRDPDGNALEFLAVNEA